MAAKRKAAPKKKATVSKTGKKKVKDLRGKSVKGGKRTVVPCF